MPDKRKHRGPHPEDRYLFASRHEPALRAAVADLAWLANREYPSRAALKLVGDRYALDERQRLAVRRATCSDADRERRGERQLASDAVANEKLSIDGFNLLTTVEAALAGGVVLHCRDGCFRDMASVHGTWRKVAETKPALELIGELLAELAVHHVLWLLDKPVSNSGRLKTRIREHAEELELPWSVDAVPNPDRVLRDSSRVVVSADSGILDHCSRWFNLARMAVERGVPAAWVLDLSSD